jgi:DNA-binding NtrC family response regulator
MPVSTQAKILRVIQEKEVERLGGTRPIKLDFRVIAATNKDLSLEIKRGTFRPDLYFRLKIFHINTPPLREIKEDIPRIAYYLLSTLREKREKAPSRFSQQAMELFLAYPWPGNIRELKNAIERAIYLAEGEEIRVEDLPIELRGFSTISPASDQAGHLKERLTNAERSAIVEAMRQAGGNKARAARILGIHRTGLYQKLKRHGLL